MRYKAEPYQLEGIKFLIKNPRSGLFADPGTGKTGVTLAKFVACHRKGALRRMLVIAPILVCYNTWPEEIKKFEQFRHLKCCVLHGPNKTNLLDEIDNFDVVCINPEGLKWFFASYGNEVKKGVFDVLTVDESSMFKSHKAQRFKMLKKYVRFFKHRHILTGTPTPNTSMELFPQTFILDEGSTLGRTITQFRERFCYLVNPKFYTYDLIPGAEKKIHDLTSKFFMRFDECQFKLPDRIEYSVPVELPAGIMREYKRFEKTFFALLEEAEVAAESAGQKYLMCRQLANGVTYNCSESQAEEFGKTRGEVKIHDIKIQALNNIIDELRGKPVLVAYHFKHDLTQLKQAMQKRFGYEVPHIGGDTKSADVNKTIALWNAGKLPVLLCHPMSMSHGLNLQHGGNDIVWYTITDSLERYIQLNKRLHRRGVKDTVRIHRLIAKNTIDEKIVERLENKDTQQKKLLNFLRGLQNA